MSSKLIGHRELFKDFVNFYNLGKLPNKILLSGHKGIGKSVFSSHFLNYIFSKGEEYPYDLENNEILKRNKSYNLYFNNVHPNIFKIQKNVEKKNIEIEQIRNMIKFQNSSSFNNKERFVLIDDAEFLNINSTNALLKSIEEPNSNLNFIIIHDSNVKIKETLKSRCIEFKLYLKSSEIEFIIDSYFKNSIYSKISEDFKTHYNNPSFLINFIKFCNDKEIDFENISITEFIKILIDNKNYLKENFVLENLNFFIELFFYRNSNLVKNYSYDLKEYFYQKLSNVKKYNLDLESFFIEFEDVLINE